MSKTADAHRNVLQFNRYHYSVSRRSAFNHILGVWFLFFHTSFCPISSLWLLRHLHAFHQPDVISRCSCTGLSDPNVSTVNITGRCFHFFEPS